jgi:hypothetical protein
VAFLWGLGALLRQGVQIGPSYKYAEAHVTTPTGDQSRVEAIPSSDPTYTFPKSNLFRFLPLLTFPHFLKRKEKKRKAVEHVGITL